MLKEEIMINFDKVKKFCRDDITKIKNYELALNDETKTWDCHHINELTFTKKELIKMKMYYNRPAYELIFLTRKEHKLLHTRVCAGSEEISKKISNSTKGNPRSEFGKKFKEHFKINCYENYKLFWKEKHFYYRHNHKCSWE